MTALELAILFHETYERLAPEFGYETRQDTKLFDETSKNGRLMVAVCGEVQNKLYSQVCQIAEGNMEKTGKLEGAHYAALRKVFNKEGK